MINIDDSIKNKIYTIRNVQVMLDSDLAVLYNVDIKRLNEQVSRNIERFPLNFMFQLTEAEYKSLVIKFATKEGQILRSQIVTLNKESLRSQFSVSIEGALKPQIGLFNEESLRSQIATLNKGRGKHKKYFPYAFTEQGVAMLSGVLRSETAVKVSIQIVNAFVNMRRFISSNALIFQRLDNVEIKQLEYQTKTDKNFEKVFDAIEDKSFQKKQGIFFEGQVFDAYVFVSDLIRSAKSSIILIEGFE